MEAFFIIVALITLILTIIMIVKFFDLCSDVKEIRNRLSGAKDTDDATMQDYSKPTPNPNKIIDVVFLAILAMVVIAVIVSAIK